MGCRLAVDSGRVRCRSALAVVYCDLLFETAGNEAMMGAHLVETLVYQHHSDEDLLFSLEGSSLHPSVVEEKAGSPCSFV